MAGYHFQRLRDIQRTRDVVALVEQKFPELNDDYRDAPLRRRHARLTENLAAASTPDAPTTAMATFQVAIEGDDALGDEDDYPVYNRSAASFSAGDYVVVEEIDDDDRWYVAAGSGSTAGSSGSGCCSCICIAAGDILVDGYETTSRWTVSLPALHVTVTHGTLTLPVLGPIVLTWDEGDGYWSLDVSADVTATYNDDSDATGDLESDVSCIVKFEHDDGSGYTKLTVSLNGSIPNPVQSFSSDFSDDFE